MLDAEPDFPADFGNKISVTMRLKMKYIPEIFRIFFLCSLDQLNSIHEHGCSFLEGLEPAKIHL